MRIAITGDTHVPITSEAELQKLANAISASAPDVVVHCGDIGEPVQTTDYIKFVLDVIRDTVLRDNPATQFAAIAGNHDIWTQGTKYQSSELWAKILPELAERSKWSWLEHQSLVVGSVAIVGSYLHYDYSAKDTHGAAHDYIANKIRTLYPEWTEDEYYDRMKKRAINDSKFFKGLPKDKEFAAQIGVKFRERLLEAEKHPGITSIVVATHVSCMPSQITRRPGNLNWSIATAYFGNLSHVDFIKDLGKVRFVVSGHSHVGNENLVAFADGHTVRVINLDSNYRHPTFKLLEIKQ